MRRFVLAALCLFALSGTARAAPLVWCLSGCPSPELKAFQAMQKANLVKGLTLHDMRLKADDLTPKDQWWVGPSVGFDAITRYSSDNSTRVGLIPGVGMGVKYRPVWWTYTDVFLALDVFVQASLITTGSYQPFTIDALPVLTFADWIGLGYGRRWILATDKEHPDSGGWIFSIGIRKSIGNPNQ